MTVLDLAAYTGALEEERLLLAIPHFEFDEALHARDNHGKFAKKIGGLAPGGKLRTFKTDVMVENHDGDGYRVSLGSGKHKRSKVVKDEDAAAKLAARLHHKVLKTETADEGDDFSKRMAALTKRMGIGQPVRVRYNHAAVALSAESWDEELNMAIHFDPSLHPRDPEGHFRQVLGGLKTGESVTMPGGWNIHKSEGGGFSVGRNGLRVAKHDTEDHLVEHLIPESRSGKKAHELKAGDKVKLGSGEYHVKGVEKTIKGESYGNPNDDHVDVHLDSGTGSTFTRVHRDHVLAGQDKPKTEAAPSEAHAREAKFQDALRAKVDESVAAVSKTTDPHEQAFHKSIIDTHQKLLEERHKQFGKHTEAGGGTSVKEATPNTQVNPATIAALKAQHTNQGQRESVASKFKPRSAPGAPPPAAPAAPTPRPASAPAAKQSSHPGRGPSGKVRNFRAMQNSKFETEAWSVIDHEDRVGRTPDHDVLDAVYSEALSRGGHGDILDKIDTLRGTPQIKPVAAKPKYGLGPRHGSVAAQQQRQVAARHIGPQPGSGAPAINRAAAQQSHSTRPGHSMVGRSDAGRPRNYKAMSDAKFHDLLPHAERYADQEVWDKVLAEAKARGLR